LNHPSFAELIDYLAQKLNVAAQAEVDSHLATCSDCQHLVTIARHTLGSSQKEKLIAPPADLVQRAVSAFRRSQKQLAERVRVAATLQFDNFAQVAALGARGVAGARQLLYSFDEFDLDVQIGTVGAPDNLALRGQLLPNTALASGLAGITVQLASAQHGPWLRLTDKTGYFNFSQVRAGDYELEILLETRAVLIAPLVLPG
jgi:hypothetical protein